MQQNKTQVVPKDSNAFNKEREDLLFKQFAQQRKGLDSQRQEAQKQVKDVGDRTKSRVGALGGSVMKAENKAIKDVSTGFADVESNLAAQEAAALNQLKGEQQQQRQFEKTLDFQRDSFAQQMAFQWKEFDENLKTNFINAATALKEAGLKDAGDWSKLLGSEEGILPQLFGDRSPQVKQRDSIDPLGKRTTEGTFV